MKHDYFDQDGADIDDRLLTSAIDQEFVPATCLLGGTLVMLLKYESIDPCNGCDGPRERCGGRAFD